jgi:hypothetical protein
MARECLHGLGGNPAVHEYAAADLEVEIVIEGLDLESVREAHENRRLGRRTGGVLTHHPGRQSGGDPSLRFLLLAILLGDFLFKLLQSRLEQANFGGCVVRPCRSDLEGHESDQCHSREGLFLVSQFHWLYPCHARASVGVANVAIYLQNT